MPEQKNNEVKLIEIEEIDLYQKRQKIYTRRISGFFQSIRVYTGWALIIGYFGTPWIQWGERQAVLFDLPSRQFHIYGITFWPQDFTLLSAALIISAFTLFLVTVLAGRVWCGYTCPQTAWTFAFMWVEEMTEGRRHQRINLDQQTMSADKFLRKLAKHSLWLGFAGMTAIAFVGYFSPIRELVADIFTFHIGNDGLGDWVLFWLFFFTGATYMNAGWLREQVCLHMCPYARFQSVMFDQDTLIVSYDEKRGEGRGPRKKGEDYKALGLGDCIDCQMCVQVCPTGIDIRDGLQYECIGCALCIDVCDDIMGKMKYDPGLIRYTTEHNLSGHEANIFRPRMLAYAAALIMMIAAFAFTIITRTPLDINISRDRNQLFIESSEGLIENIYSLQILNMDQKDHQYKVTVQGFNEFTLIGNTETKVASGENITLPLRLAVDPAYLKRTNTTIYFTVTSSTNSHIKIKKETRFLSPRFF